MGEGTGSFVGRQQEIAAVVASILAAGSPGAVVTGEPGSGKSVLSRQVLARLEGRVRSFPVHASKALSGIRYGALAPYLGRLGPTADAMAVMRTMNDCLRSGEPAQTAGTEPAQPSETPALLVVDNAQELDAGSSFVIGHLAMSGAARVLILSRRSGRSPELGFLGPGGPLKHIRLPQLNPAEVHELCTQALSGSVAKGTSASINEASAGNPMFVQALLGLGLRSHTLVQRNGIWLLINESPVPDGPLGDLARSLAAERPAGERHVLELLALAGGLPYSLLRRLADEADTGNLLDEGILVRCADERQTVVFRSPVFARVLAGAVPFGRSAAIRQNVEKARGTDGTPLAGRYLEWGLECGQTAPPEELIAAARVANDQHRPQRALHLAEAADVPGYSTAAKVQQARALAAAGRTAEAHDLLREALTGKLQGADARDAAALTLQLAHRSPQAADELQTAAESWQGYDDGETAVRIGGSGIGWTDAAALIPHLAANLQSLDPGPQSEIRLRQLAGQHDAGNGARLAALAILAERVDARGRSVEAQRLAVQAVALLGAEGTGSLQCRAFVLTRMMFAIIHAGRYWQVEEYLKYFNPGPGSSPSYLRGSAEFFTGLVSARQGKLQQSLDHLVPAIEELRLADPETLLPLALGLAAYTAHRLGERSRAAKYAAQFHQIPPQGPRHRWLVAAAYVQAVKAQTADGAAQQLAALAAEAQACGFLRAEKEILELLCRNGRLERLERLGQLGTAFEGQEASIGYRAAAAQAAQDPELLLDAAHAAENAHHYLDAAECLAAAAAIYAKSGEPRQSGLVRHRLNRLLHRVDGLASGSLPEPAEAAELTRREQEIVAMAVKGLSNREIAKRLFVSQRTVEGHLYRTFSKLGITQRKELEMVAYRVTGTIATSRRTEHDS